MRVSSILAESSPSKYNPTTQTAQPQSDKPEAPTAMSSSSFTPVNTNRPPRIQPLPSLFQTPHQPATEAPLQVIQPVQGIPPVQPLPAIQPSPSEQPPVQMQQATDGKAPAAPAAQLAQPIHPVPSATAIIPRSATDRRYAHERYFDQKRDFEAAQKAAGIAPTPFREITADDLEDMEPDMSPQLVRNKLNELFDVEKYGKGKFCEKRGTTNKSLNTFMKMTGSNGRQTSAYEAGWKFFKLRQLNEKFAKEMEKAQQPKKRKSAGGEEGAPPAKAAKTASGKSAAQPPHVDISDIHLPGEDTDSVEVYGTVTPVVPPNPLSF